MYGESVEISLSTFVKDARKYVDAAKDGGEVLVTDGGIPVVRLTKVGAADLLARLERDGLINAPVDERAVPRLPQAEAAKDALSSLMGRLRR